MTPELPDKPNLLRRLAEVPPLVGAFQSLARAFAGTSFTEREREVISTVVSVENRCTYCVAFHRRLMAGDDPAHVAALRAGAPLPDPRLDALAGYVRALVRGRGEVPAETAMRLAAAGFTEAQAREAIVGVAFQTLSNYANHVARAPLDEALEPYRWPE